MMANLPPTWIRLQFGPESVAVNVSNMMFYATNTLQYTTDLNSGSWNNMAIMMGIQEATLFDTVRTQCFYRVQTSW